MVCLLVCSIIHLTQWGSYLQLESQDFQCRRGGGNRNHRIRSNSIASVMSCMYCVKPCTSGGSAEVFLVDFLFHFGQSPGMCDFGLFFEVFFGFVLCTVACCGFFFVCQCCVSRCPPPHLGRCRCCNSSSTLCSNKPLPNSFP